MNVIVVTWSTVFGQMLTFWLDPVSFYTRTILDIEPMAWTSLGRPKK